MFTVFTFRIGSQMEKQQKLKQKFENADLESVIE